MNSMKYYILLLFTAVVFMGCEEFVNSAEESVVTYLPKIDVEGETEVNVPCDNTGAFEDPGAVASEGGQEIPVKSTIGGIYFDGTAINGPDLYNITYSAYNVDSIPGVASREIFWPACNGDMINSIAGMYEAKVFRTHTSGATVDYTEEAFDAPYWIRDLGGGKFGISDIIGYFYQSGYGYGTPYAGTGMVVTANNIATNDFTYGDPIGVGAFGGECEIVAGSFKVNAATKTITFSSEWSFGYVFDVTLKQVDPSTFEF